MLLIFFKFYCLYLCREGRGEKRRFRFAESSKSCFHGSHQRNDKIKDVGKLTEKPEENCVSINVNAGVFTPMPCKGHREN